MGGLRYNDKKRICYFIEKGESETFYNKISSLNEAVKSMAEAQPNPRTWLAWIVYLLARLEEKATNENPAYRESFLDMLSALQDELRNRTRTGGWH